MSLSKVPMVPAQKIAAALEKEIDSEQLARVLRDALSATTTNRNGTTEADNRTRLAALSLAMAYLIGRPVERQEIVNVNLDADSAVGMEERLRHSPALRQMFRQMLDRADGDRAIDA